VLASLGRDAPGRLPPLLLLLSAVAMLPPLLLLLSAVAMLLLLLLGACMPAEGTCCCDTSCQPCLRGLGVLTHTLLCCCAGSRLLVLYV
jgi:hypothetical protein